jgi:hypothetical protein
VTPEAVQHARDEHQQMAGWEPRPSPYTDGRLGSKDAL